MMHYALIDYALSRVVNELYKVIWSFIIRVWAPPPPAAAAAWKNVHNSIIKIGMQLLI